MLDYPLELLARVADARLQGPGDAMVRRVSTDSRSIEPGDLFVAIAGEKFDGHQFVAQALEAGAVGAVVNPERLPAAARKKNGLLEVADPLLTLGQLAQWHRNRFPVHMVAVTGSVGKTTTKDLIASVLSAQYHTLKSPGNLNAEIGLPLTLFELTAKHQVAVVEMAMRGAGQIRYLARLARPEIAVITNIGLSHMELLGSQDAIAAAKAEVLDFLPHGGTAVLNGDDPYLPYLKARVPSGVNLVTFGMDREDRDSISGMYLGPEIQETSNHRLAAGTRCTIRAAKGHIVQRSYVPLLGRHNLRNALAAAAVGNALGVGWPRIRRGLAEAEISAMRTSLVRLSDGSLLLDDAYNASSPDAMLAALEIIRELGGMRKTVVLGSMLELGPATEEAHRQVGAAVAEVHPTTVITVGEHARLIAESAVEAGYPEANVFVTADNAEALEKLAGRRRPGDIILVKGSRGMAMETIVEALTRGK